MSQTNKPTVQRRASNRRTSFDAAQDPVRVACRKIKRAKEVSRNAAQMQFESGPGLKRSRSLLALGESDPRKKRARKIESAYVSRYNKQEYTKVLSGFVGEVQDEISGLKVQKSRVEKENEILRMQIESMRYGVQYGIQLAAGKVQAPESGARVAVPSVEVVGNSGAMESAALTNSVTRHPTVDGPELSAPQVRPSASNPEQPVGSSEAILSVEDGELVAPSQNEADEYASEIYELFSGLRGSANDDALELLHDNGQFLVEQYMNIPPEDSTGAPAPGCYAPSSSSDTCFSDDTESSCSYLTEVMEGRRAEEQCGYLADPLFESKSEPLSPAGVVDFALQSKDADSLTTKLGSFEVPRYERVEPWDDELVARPVAAA